MVVKNNSKKVLTSFFLIWPLVRYHLCNCG